MNCREIIAKWLKENGYDGLCNEFMGCGCDVEDLGPCDDFGAGDCEPAYKRKATPEDDNEWGSEYLYDPEKPESEEGE